MYRRKLNRKSSKRNFQRGNRVNKRNNIPIVRRGGYRL
nr:MAG: hypothetical protein [Microvirus sp.]